MKLRPDCQLLALAAQLFLGLAAASAEEERIPVLFLGDRGHHRPADCAAQLIPVLAKRGIDVVYTEKVEDLNAENLSRYECVIVFANIDAISPAEEKALLDHVAAGKGFVPLHCASYCFRNSSAYVDLVGAQFQRHGTGVFRTRIVEPEHPVMRGFAGFESWDETYVHHRHNERDRTVLSYRDEGDHREPWTWVRRHGEGRVFYTAWGHDHRTWGHPGFHNLVERGIRWTAGRDVSVVPAFTADAPFPVPEMTARRTDVAPFEYVEAKVPNYLKGQRWGTQGEPIGRMQRPVSPDESMKHMVVPRGFRVELFASEPDLGGKPICMNWDARGRLWVAETIDYPNELQPPGKGRDRIRICEDTDGDNRADRFTVFAEKLSIPTSLTFYKGGIILQAQKQTLFLKDHDGDDRADEQRVLLEGWSMGDTHGGASNFHWGLDNWIWGMQGYNDSRFNVGGEELRFRQGFFRFKPDASKLEFIRSTNNNTWGLGFSEEGLVFGSTANRNPSVYMPIANRYYEAVRGWSAGVLGSIADTHLFKPVTDKVRQVDQHDGYTAGAGHALYTARTYPKEYWNRTAFVNGPTGHLTGTFVLRRDGTDFRSTSPFNLLASHDEWTAPIMAEVGPDGHVWVIDWYNFIVQHNPTPRGFRTGRGNAYETELRDKKHGRIYRVVYEKAPPAARLNLDRAPPGVLVETLRNTNRFWRLHAQRLLVERGGSDAVPALIALAGDRSVDEIGLNAPVIHALWTLHGLGALDAIDSAASRSALAALDHPSAGVRRNAVLVLPRVEATTRVLLDRGLLDDPEPHVRLATLLALSELPADADAGAAVLAALREPATLADRWLPDAATSAAARHDVHFLRALAAVEQPPPKLLDVVGIVAQHHARGAPAAVDSLLAGVAECDPEVAARIVRGLADGWPQERQANLSPAVEKKLIGLLSRLPAGSRGLLIKLATTWGSDAFAEHASEVADSLLAVVTDRDRGDEERVRAAGEMVEFLSRSDEAVEKILALVTPQTPPAVASGLIEALRKSEADAVGSMLVERLRGLTPTCRDTALRVLLGRTGSTRAFLTALEEGEAQVEDLSLDQKQALSTHPDRRIARRARRLLERGGTLPSADRKQVLERMLPLTKRKGDVEAGKLVYEKLCAKCHVHGDIGTRIGPDLTGMAVHPKEEILTNIVDPNQSVEGNYRVYTVVSRNGQVVTGLLASESRTSLEILDAEAKKHVVLREDIVKLDRSERSLMPEGFEGQMSEADLVNVLEFLAARGKFLPIPLEKVATIVSTQGMFHSKQSRAERLVLDDWSPRTVEGVPFRFVDPRGDRQPNVVLLHGPNGAFPPRMPRSVTLPCNATAKAVHFLSGVSGWGFPLGEKGSVSMVVRLRYADGETEDHELENGVHFADYISRNDVPGSKLAFMVRGRQMRFLTIQPRRSEPIESIELVKGRDRTAPIVMAVTVESP